MSVHHLKPAVPLADARLRERIVLVTGGSGGIGLACARAFALAGARVAIAGRDPAHLHAAVDRLRGEGLHVLPLMADLARPEQALQMAASLVAQLGVADVVVNAMVGRGRGRDEAGEQPLEWWDAMQARLLPVLQALQALLPGMRARGRGAIVNLATARVAAGPGARPTAGGVVGLVGAEAEPGAGLAARAAAGTATAGARLALAALGASGLSVPAPQACAADALAQAGATLAARVAVDGLRVNTVLTPVLAGPSAEQTADRVADCVLFLAGPAAAAVNGATIAAGG